MVCAKVRERHIWCVQNTLLLVMILCACRLFFVNKFLALLSGINYLLLILILARYLQLWILFY